MDQSETVLATTLLSYCRQDTRPAGLITKRSGSVVNQIYGYKLRLQIERIVPA
jgi:hypothetical protein